MVDHIERDKAIDAIVQAVADGRNNFYTILKAIPAADVVEVVRCGECRHCSIDYYSDGNEPTYVCLLEDMGTNKDFYCANGERVSEDED